MTRRPILKNSLLSLYRNSDEIMECLQLIDWSVLDKTFYDTLFTHIAEEEFWEVDNFLNSDKVLSYYQAVDKAAMSLTGDLAALIELAVATKGIKH